MVRGFVVGRIQRQSGGPFAHVSCGSGPARAVSVPVRRFHDGKEIRVGATAAAVAAARTCAEAAAGVDPARSDNGSPFYEYAGSRFILVSNRSSGRRSGVAAIIFLRPYVPYFSHSAPLVIAVRLIARTGPFKGACARLPAR